MYREEERKISCAAIHDGGAIDAVALELVEGSIRTSQREHCYLRVNWNLGCDPQEIFAILPCIVCRATHHTFLIKQIVIERRDLAHVNSNKNPHAASLQSFQCRGDELSRRSEDDGRVQLRGRLSNGFTGPHGAER